MPPVPGPDSFDAFVRQCDRSSANRMKALMLADPPVSVSSVQAPSHLSSSQSDSLQQLGPEEDSEQEESEEERDVRLNGQWTQVGKKGKPRREKRPRASPNGRSQVATAAGLPGRSASRSPSTPPHRPHQHASSSPPCKRRTEERHHRCDEAMEVDSLPSTPARHHPREEAMEVDPPVTTPAQRC